MDRIVAVAEEREERKEIEHKRVRTRPCVELYRVVLEVAGIRVDDRACRLRYERVRRSDFVRLGRSVHRDALRRIDSGDAELDDLIFRTGAAVSDFDLGHDGGIEEFARPHSGGNERPYVDRENDVVRVIGIRECEHVGDIGRRIVADGVREVVGILVVGALRRVSGVEDAGRGEGDDRRYRTYDPLEFHGVASSQVVMLGSGVTTVRERLV